MSAADPLSVVEAGYRFVPDEREWLRGIVDAAAPHAIGTGVSAYTVELAKQSRVAEFVARDTSDAFAGEIHAFTSALVRARARAVYSPTEFVGNATFRVQRLAKQRRMTVDRFTNGAPIQAWALVAGDPRSRALAVAFPADDATFAPDRPFPRARVLGLAGAHLGAALRLRRLATPLPGEDPDTESVLSPEGRVLHATGDARGRAQRESLTEAVLRRERARGRLRRVDPQEATALWSVLVDGRWSIVDFVERDGKRLLLARKNPVEGPDVLALTDDERDVLWLATMGHSYKYIAYELGLSIPAVTRRLGTALRKVRASSRRDLLRKLGAMQPAPERTK